MTITFDEYWNSFFCWAGEYERAPANIKKQARKGYKDYCKHIGQEPVF